MNATVDLIIRGGTVVNSNGRRAADVLIGDGRILALVEPGEQHVNTSTAQVIDATGKLVLPGGVDPHCHVATALGEFTTADDYQQTSTAALHGGTTTIVDFAIPGDHQTPVEAVAERTKLAEQSRCSVALHGCVRKPNADTAAQLTELAAGGVTTVKLFTTYRDLMMVGPDDILAIMKTMRKLGGLTYVHAESNHIIENTQAQLAAAGRIGSADHALSRPEISETAAVAEVLAIAEATDAAVYFVHQTIPEVVDMVSLARNRGVRAYSETCTHYITLDSTSYATKNPERYVCCPPLRDPATVEQLRRRVLGGGIDTIGSDHCCFHGSDKARAGHDVRAMPYGMPGVETRLPIVFSEFVHHRGMTVERFVDLTSTTPARLNGLDHRKGHIAPGADADIAIWDTNTQRTLHVDNLHMGIDYEPYEGRTVHGWPTHVITNGKIAIHDGHYTDPGPGTSRLIANPIFHPQPESDPTHAPVSTGRA
jgi:dihydropyrimidinase